MSSHVAIQKIGASFNSPVIRPVLVTGGAGFIGCNLVDHLATEGHHVLILDALSRPGVERNLAWLRGRHPRQISFVRADVADAHAASEAAESVSAVFHFAAQVAVTTSLEDPRRDFAVNVQGTLNLLEALRKKNGSAPLIFASTNKVYGNLADVDLALIDNAWQPQDVHLRAQGIGRGRPLDFHTPYGCSKGAADQYVLDYARSFNVPTAVLRMSCIYGPHQMGTEDQGWVAHFLIKALAGETITLFGDGRQVRDILYVEDAVSAYLSAWKSIDKIKGNAFNLGGGPANAVSLLQLIDFIEKLVGRPVATSFLMERPGDQRYYVSNISDVCNRLSLAAPRNWQSGVTALAQWLQSQSARQDEMVAPEQREPAYEDRPR